MVGYRTVLPLPSHINSAGARRMRRFLATALVLAVSVFASRADDNKSPPKFTPQQQQLKDLQAQFNKDRSALMKQVQEAPQAARAQLYTTKIAELNATLAPKF